MLCAMHVCYMWLVHMCLHACWSQGTTPGIISKEPSTLSFERGSLHGTWGSPIWLNWLTSEPQGFTCPSSRELGLQVHTAVPGCFMWILGIELESSCLSSMCLSTEPPPQHPCCHFLLDCALYLSNTWPLIMYSLICSKHGLQSIWGANWILLFIFLSLN